MILQQEHSSFRHIAISVLLLCAINRIIVAADEQQFDVPGRVMVIAARTKIMQGDKRVSTVTAGAVLNVSQKNGNWLGVPEREGWVSKNDVVPLKSAIGAFTKNVIKTESATAYFHRGIAYLALEQPQKALNDFDVAIKKESKRGTLYTSRGLAFQRLGRTDAAFADFTQAITLNHKDANAYYNRSILYTEQKNIKLAMEDLNNSIAAYDKYAPAYNNRGTLWTMQGQYNKAIADLTEAIRLNPRYAAAFDNRGLAYKRLGKFDSARNDYQQSIAIDANAPAPHNDYAWLLATCPQKKYRDGKLALEHAQQACKLWNYKNVDGLDTLAAAYAELGEFKTAIRTIDTALEIAPQSARESLIEKRRLYAKRRPFRDE